MTQKQLAARRDRFIALVEVLPGAKVCGGQHLSLEVRGKRFGWFLYDHHGDGRLALNCRAPRSVSREFATSSSPAFHIPKYVGQHGWVGYWLDLPKVDWEEVRQVLADAYKMTAPKRLAAELEIEAPS